MTAVRFVWQTGTPIYVLYLPTCVEHTHMYIYTTKNDSLKYIFLLFFHTCIHTFLYDKWIKDSDKLQLSFYFCSFDNSLSFIFYFHSMNMRNINYFASGKRYRSKKRERSIIVSNFTTSRAIVRIKIYDRWLSNRLVVLCGFKWIMSSKEHDNFSSSWFNSWPIYRHISFLI